MILHTVRHINNRTEFQCRAFIPQLEYPVQIFLQSPTFSCKFCQVKSYDIRCELSYCLLILCAAMRRNAYAYKPFPDLLHYLRLLPIERHVYSVAFDSFLFLLACKADFVRIWLLTYTFWLVSITIPYMILFIGSFVDKIHKYWIHDYLWHRNRMYPPYVLFLHLKYDLNGYLLCFFFWFCIPSSNHENCILIQTHWNVVMSQKSKYRRKNIVNKLVVTMTCSS